MNSAIESYIREVVQQAITEYLQGHPTMSHSVSGGRQKYVVANWKMNLNSTDIHTFLEKFNTSVAVQKAAEQHRVVLCPAFPYLHTVKSMLNTQGSSVRLGAQNVHWLDSGAQTGEVSADMLLNFDCEYVIVGHSERRQQGECCCQINKKLKQSLAKGITPILCVGESLEDYEANRSIQVITKQLVEALKEIASPKLVIAYEPVWAIGTGKTPSLKEIERIHIAIRLALAELYNTEIAEQTSILYGGSVKAEQAKELQQIAEVDGLLVGGASLKAESFTEVVLSFLAKGMEG